MIANSMDQFHTMIRPPFYLQLIGRAMGRATLPTPTRQNIPPPSQPICCSRPGHNILPAGLETRGPPGAASCFALWPHILVYSSGRRGRHSGWAAGIRTRQGTDVRVSVPFNGMYVERLFFVGGLQTRKSLLLCRFNGDPGRVRTCNLPLRRGLLYPVEPRGLAPLAPYLRAPDKGVQ